MYRPFPSLSCFPNIFTGKNMGWYSNYIIIIILPVIFVLILSFYLFINFKYYHVIYFQPISQFLMFMSVLQFPLGILSLSALSCTYDSVSGEYYMTSQQWLACRFFSPIQILGALGTLVYLFAIPVLLHYWYWKSTFLGALKKQIGDIILPAGCREDAIFMIFITFRGIILALVISVIPASWNISDVILFLILGINIVFVLDRKPYSAFSEEPSEKDIKKYYELSGEALEISSIFIILTSVLLLDTKSDIFPLPAKSIFVGVLNFIFAIYFIFGIIFKTRFTNFKFI